MVWRVWTRSLTRPVSCTIRLSTGDSAGALWLFRVNADTALFGTEDATPGSRACVLVHALLGQVGRVGLLGAFWCASPFPWPVLVRSLLVQPPPGMGCPVCGCCWGFFFSFPPPRCAPFVSCFACFPALGALGFGVMLPPPLFFICPPPRCLWRFLFSGLGRLGPLRHVPPPPFFLCFFSFVSCFFLFRFFFPSSFAGSAVRGGFVCLGPSAVPVCASVVLCRSLLCVRSLVLCGCWAWLSSAVSWWVLVSCLGGAVLVWPRGPPPCGLALCVLVVRCPVLCSVALLCDLVLSCSAFCLRRCLCLLFVSCRCASAVCVMCVFWGVVLCVPCPLRAVRCLAAPCWYPFVVLCVSSVLFLVAGVVGSCCRCLLLGVCWWLWLPGVVVWWCVSALVPVSGRAVTRRLPCGVLLPCVVSCGAVLPCGAVLWCPVFFYCFCWWCWFPVVPCWFWAQGRIRVVSVSVLCLCGAVLVCMRLCSLFGALLPLRGWPVFCVVACCVRVFAVGPGCPLLSPGGSWWLLVSCLGGVLWCAPVCCAAPCCCALCRLALRCCALCCFVLLCWVLPRAVLCLGRCSSSWSPVPSGAVFCLVPPLCVCSAVVCRCVVLFAAVLCAVGCPVVSLLSSPPCAVLLCGPLSLGALLPCAVPRGTVLPRGAVVSCPAALLGLFLAWVWLYVLDKTAAKFQKKCFLLFLAFEKQMNLYTTRHTRVQPDHVRCSVLRATRRS